MNDQITAESVQQASDQDKEEPLYISPILHEMDAKHQPNPSPACETCPASMWFSTKEVLKCFCTRMHVITWDGEQPPIMTCDGRELALLALKQALDA